MLKVKMLPSVNINNGTGIGRVINKYLELMPKYGVEFVNYEDHDFDLIVSHAGASGKVCDVAITHGLYWTGEYKRAPRSWYKTNALIADAIRAAKKITVPSKWVQETFKRNLHTNPIVVPHGITVDNWITNSNKKEKFTLWNKTRQSLVCDPEAVHILAENFPQDIFVTTFKKENKNITPNMKVVGKLPFEQMKNLIQKAYIYLSTTKETFGIGTLEAMASGSPILGWDFGGNSEIVKHGVNGYLAEPYNYDDLINGYRYCLDNFDILSENSIEIAKQWPWENAVRKMYNVFLSANEPADPTVSVIIPCYNLRDKLGNAIDSVCEQTLKPIEIIIVDDGSSDNPQEIVNQKIEQYKDFNIKYIEQKNSGVANARNNGFINSSGNYICCLDADDQIAPNFLNTCVRTLENNRDIYIAYTKITDIKADGTRKKSGWPFDKINHNDQFKRRNQIPTCNVAKRCVWERTGGQRQRYAPNGAGSEDAEMWLRAFELGMAAKLASNDGLFLYNVGSGNVSGNKNYKEVDWAHHSFIETRNHNFASLAEPKNISHSVISHDNPIVSIIIPLGEGHQSHVINAIDSVYLQTFKNWELIVVDDTKDNYTETDYFKNAFPFIRTFKTPSPYSGAGIARNIGVRESRASLVFFLDADDYLENNCIEKMLLALRSYNKPAIIYSDYYGVAELSEKNKKISGAKINEAKNIIKVPHNAEPYDCERAQAQPTKDIKSFYHWCIVNCLVPKSWHNNINGFDEKLKTWEDADYYWRMAKMGYCFVHVKEPLIIYNYLSGTRRMLPQDNKNISNETIKYLLNKHKEIKIMPCRGCGKSTTRSAELQSEYKELLRRKTAKGYGGKRPVAKLQDDEYVEIIYKHRNRGDHPVVGMATGIRYGYHTPGDVFLVHHTDQQLQSENFIKVSKIDDIINSSNDITEKPEKDDSLKAPTRIKKPELKTAKNNPAISDKELIALLEDDEKGDIPKPTFNQDYNNRLDLTEIAGVTERIAERMKDAGFTTKPTILHAGVDGLQKVKGIGEARATKIIEHFENE